MAILRIVTIVFSSTLLVSYVVYSQLQQTRQRQAPAGAILPAPATRPAPVAPGSKSAAPLMTFELAPVIALSNPPAPLGPGQYPPSVQGPPKVREVWTGPPMSRGKDAGTIQGRPGGSRVTDTTASTKPRS